MCTEHDMEPDKPLRSMDLESDGSRPPRRCGSVLMSSVAKAVSAILFLFDFVTNIAVLREYFILGSKGTYKGGELDEHSSGGWVSSKKAFFYICLGLMLLDPVLTTLAFKVKLPAEEHPLRSAMFLPIVQFLRFLKGVYRTCSCARAVETTESDEAEALHAITGSIQTGPQLVLQTSVIFWVTAVASCEVSGSWKPSEALVLSIICSFLSACYNSGRACMYEISNKWSAIPNMTGIAGGGAKYRCLYTVGVVLLRCTVVVSLFYARFYQTILWYLVLYLVLGVGMCSYVNALFVALSKRRTMCSLSTQAEILLNTYNSACIGPLYPIVENDNRSGCDVRRWSVSVEIAVGVAINMLPDVVFFLVVVIQKHTPCNGWLSDHHQSIKSTFSCGLFKTYATTGLLLSILSSVALYFIAERTSSHIGLDSEM